MQVPANFKALSSSDRKPRVSAKRIGAADSKEMLTVSVRVRRRPDAPALPDPAKIAARPHGKKNYISREAFAARYGASKADMDKITQFARAQGLEVIESNAARRTVVLRGQSNR